MKLNLKKRDKIIVSAIGVLLTAFMAEKLFFSGLRVSLRNVDKEIKVEEEDFKAASEIKLKEKKIKEECDKYQPYIEKAKKILLPEFLNEVEQIARQTGVSIVSLNPQLDVSRSKEYQGFSAQLRAEAAMEQLINFIYQIKESEYLLLVENLSVSSKDEEAKVLRIETNMQVVTF